MKNEEQIAAVKAQMNAAIRRVEQIVNQPVTKLRRTPGMKVWKYSPGWFHPGAIKPDFDHVDKPIGIGIVATLLALLALMRVIRAWRPAD